jgi:hypothetical protein
MEFLYSLNLSFQDLLKFKKLSIINGIVWAIIWSGLSIILFSPLQTITISLINFLPFKFVQHAGADFILMIIWLQSVLITIGIFFSLFNQVLSNKVIPIIVALLSAIFWFVLFFTYQDAILTYLEKLLKIFPFETIEEAVSYVLVIFILYSFYIVSTYLSFLFLSVGKLEELQKEQYSSIKVDKNFSIFKLFYTIIRDLFVFIFALIVVYPLLFIPFFNIIVIIALWSFLIKESLLQTIFMIFGKTDVNKKDIWIFAVVSVVFNFVPLINLFAPAFGVLSIYHYVLEKKGDETS